MKCPLKERKEVAYTTEGSMVTGDCLKEECAWWDHELKNCSIHTLVSTLAAVGETLYRIKDKMPKDLAPGR